MNGLLEHFHMSGNPTLNAILLEQLRAVNAHDWPGIDGLTLDVVLDSYCLAAATGHVPGKQELLRQHPELAAAIEAFFSSCPATGREKPQSKVPPLYHERTD